MKTLIVALSFAAAIVAYSGNAMAGSWSSGPVAITAIEINDVYGRNSGASFYLTFNAAPMNTGCSGGSAGQWLIASGIYPNSPNTEIGTQSIRDMAQQATSAKLAGRSVKVYWNGNCSGGGTSGIPVLTGLLIN
jgi:hypothetical protein